MKILFLTDNFPPEVNAPASRTFEHIREWNKAENIHITVITCFPNFPKGKVYKGYKQKLVKTEIYKGIKVIRVWTYITKNSGKYRRILDYLSFAIMAFSTGLFINYDIIVATSPQFFTTWAGYFLSKIKKVPWIFELRDLWPESILSLGTFKNKYLIKLLEKIEICLYKDCNKIVAVTNSFKENLIQRGIDYKKISIIQNGVDLKLFKNNSLKISSNKLLKIKKENFVIGYIGTHGMAHGLDFVIDSIPKLNIPNLFFLFIGDGSEKQNLIKIAKEKSIKNILFIEMMNKIDLIKYYELLDISLVCLKKRDAFKKVIPSKIFESSAMSKPILLGVEGESEKLITEYNAGINYIPENFSDFKNKILLLMDRNIYKKCKLGCKKLADNYDRSKLAIKMLEIIKNELNNVKKSS